ncbi:ubiquinone anaerobic biosynthesis accessory factor UbiT [Pseudidiomarina sp.]|uniref:ubiquinone anaerobic biosynthesis accessory factor UbiT n=1 Tax=Pseudidiomarina sp. TaxID=2081707 RepID=UPI00299EE138|nr:SCP2 sterol-binding domain-containing protein [Pseudidiomarina sp.]MDX1705924.1 SCP2 sterol-binding domain-containing protein [Pseudidiomarina sp.]
MVIPKVVEQLPALTKACLRCTPDALIAASMSAAMNQILRSELRRGEFAFLQGRWVRVQVTDLDFSFYVSVAGDDSRPRLQVSMHEQPADVTMRGEMPALLLLISNKVDPDTLFFRRKLLIVGDTELGLQIKNLLDTIELKERLPGILYRFSDQLAEQILTQQSLTGVN